MTLDCSKGRKYIGLKDASDLIIFVRAIWDEGAYRRGILAYWGSVSYRRQKIIQNGNSRTFLLCRYPDAEIPDFELHHSEGSVIGS